MGTDARLLEKSSLCWPNRNKSLSVFLFSFKGTFHDSKSRQKMRASHFTFVLTESISKVLDEGSEKERPFCSSRKKE